MEICYRTIIHEIDNLGLTLSKISDEKKRNLRLKVSFDLLKKVGHNVWILSKIKGLEHSTTSMNLIYRSVILDLMLALFLLDINDEEFKYSLKKMDVDHVKYMKEALLIRLNLGRKIFKPQEDEDIKEQDLFDQYYDYFNNYIESKKGEPWRIVSLSSPEGFTFRGTTKSIYEYLRDSKRENLKALSNLYMFYKYFSQTEHYSLLGNKYPFEHENDDHWYKECDISIYSGIAEINRFLEQYY